MTPPSQTYRTHGRIKASHHQTTSFADGQVAAIAASQQLVLITRNTKDFAGFEGLALQNWLT